MRINCFVWVLQNLLVRLENANNTQLDSEQVAKPFQLEGSRVILFIALAKDCYINQMTVFSLKS